jgi:hypothetical protein
MSVLSNAALPGNSLNGSIGSMVGQSVVSSALGAVGLSQASGRMNVAGMYQYSNNTSGPIPQATFFPNANQDWRVRVSLPWNSDYFYNDPAGNTLLSPLTSVPGSFNTAAQAAFNNIAGQYGNGTNPTTRIGVVFPYTPQIQITHTANYSKQQLTHSNYANFFYDNSEVGEIAISADFTVQSVDEGQYLLATIYFFRSITKMFFGADPQAGTPPPIVYLNGYGQYYLPNVPCIVKSFSHTMPADVDYMDIPEPYVTNSAYNPLQTSMLLNSTRLPTSSAVAITLQPVYSRFAQSQGFSLNDFAAGALVNPAYANNPATAFGASQQQRYAGNGTSTNKPVGGFL